MANKELYKKLKQDAKKIKQIFKRDNVEIERIRYYVNYLIGADIKLIAKTGVSIHPFTLKDKKLFYFTSSLYFSEPEDYQDYQISTLDDKMLSYLYRRIIYDFLKLVDKFKEWCKKQTKSNRIEIKYNKWIF